MRTRIGTTNGYLGSRSIDTEFASGLPHLDQSEPSDRRLDFEIVRRGLRPSRSSFPDDECVAFPEGLQAGSEPWSVVLFSRGHITLEGRSLTPARAQGLAKRESIAGLRYMIELLRFPTWT